MNSLQNNIEEADKNIIRDVVGDGILEGLDVSKEGSNNFIMTIKKGVAYLDGRRIANVSDLQKNIENYKGTTRYITLAIKFVINSYNVVIDGKGDHLLYNNDESSEIVIFEGTQTPPAVTSDVIILSDVYINGNNTTINSNRVQKLHNSQKLISMSHQLKNEISRVENVTLEEQNASATLPQTSKSLIVTILQTIRNNLKRLFQTATQSMAGLMSETDKKKLDGIDENANKYAHPDNHLPSIIIQDASNRFMTDAEKTKLAGIVPVGYGTCSTSEATIAKVVTLAGFELKIGACIGIKFANTNTRTNPTLNVNNTGAKDIVLRENVPASGGAIGNDKVLYFQYDGTYWWLINPSILPVAQGGIGLNTIPSGDILIGNGANTIQSIPPRQEDTNTPAQQTNNTNSLFSRIFDHKHSTEDRIKFLLCMDDWHKNSGYATIETIRNMMHRTPHIETLTGNLNLDTFLNKSGIFNLYRVNVSFADTSIRQGIMNGILICEYTSSFEQIHTLIAYNINYGVNYFVTRYITSINTTPNIQKWVNYLHNIQPVAQGGTGATDAATARTNLGITPANIGAVEIAPNTVIKNVNSFKVYADQTNAVSGIGGFGVEIGYSGNPQKTRFGLVDANGVFTGSAKEILPITGNNWWTD